MKLVYVTASMPYGPWEAFFIPEVKQLVRAGHEVLIVPRSPARKVINEDARGLEKRSLRRPLISAGILAAAFIEALGHPVRVLRALGWMLRSRSPWVTLKNLAVLAKGLWLGRVARRWGAAHIHVHWGTTTSTMAMVGGATTGIPWSLTLHRGDILENNLLVLKAGKARFVRFIAADGLEMVGSVCGRPLRGRTCVLHLGIDVPSAPAGRRRLHEPPLLLCPAHLSERKGQRYLIEAVRRLRDHGVPVTLWLAGVGDSRPALEAMVAQMALDRDVVFLGQVGHFELLNLYAQGKVDVVVLPSLHEGIPVALMEAMAYGIPVVATHTGGVPELLAPDAGILVPPKDAAALADALVGVLKDAALRERLGQAGRRRVLEQFSVEQIVNELVKQMECAPDAKGR